VTQTNFKIQLCIRFYRRRYSVFLEISNQQSEISTTHSFFQSSGTEHL